MLGQGAGRLRPSAPAPGPHPPRHQPQLRPLRLPPRTRNNAGSARSRSAMSQCSASGHGRGDHAMPTSSRSAIRPALRCVHRRLWFPSTGKPDCPHRPRAARRRPSRPHDPQQRPPLRSRTTRVPPPDRRPGALQALFRGNQERPSWRLPAPLAGPSTKNGAGHRRSRRTSVGPARVNGDGPRKGFTEASIDGMVREAGVRCEWSRA